MSTVDRPVLASSAAVRWYALWLGPFVALALYAPTLGGTFLSDDFLVNSMLHHGAVPAVNWPEILADFTRGWAGLDSPLYRPLISVSFAVTYAIGGVDPFLFHLTNVGAHVLATLVCAMLCASCSPQRANLAAIVGGLIFALHPIAAEPTCWIAARTAGLQVLFATAAMACFARHLRRAGRGGNGALVAAVAFFATALLCKESAVLVPFSCIALDLLIRGPGRTPGRLALHLPMFVTLAAYFLVRLLVLGTLLGGSEDASAQPIHGDALGNLLDKFAILFLPAGNSLPLPWAYVGGAAVLIGTAILVVPAFWGRGRRGFAILGIAWLALYFAPTFRLTVNTHNLSGSRMVYGAVVIFAVYVATLTMGTARTTRTTRAASGRRLTSGLALLLLGSVSFGTARMVQYLRAFADMRTLQTSLAAHARVATPARPLAFLSVTPPALGIPFLNCNALYPLAEIPLAAVDTPSISLGYVSQPVPLSESLLFDLGTVRAVREQGASLLDWINYPPPLTPRFEVRPAYRAHVALPGLTRQPEAARQPGSARFYVDGPVDPWDVEEIDVEVAGECSGGRLEWLYTTESGGKLANVQEYRDLAPAPQFRDAPRSVPFGPGEARGTKTVFHVDVSHSLTFVAVGMIGRLAGFQVITEGAEGAGGVKVGATAMRLHNRVHVLKLPVRMRGATTRLDAAAAQLHAPDLPDGTDRMTLFLLGPDTAIPLRNIRPGPIRLGTATQRAIANILRSSRQKRWYFYFEAKGVRSYRSPIDWLVFAR